MPTMKMAYSVVPEFGESVEFGEQVRGLGCADPLEYLQCLPQEGPGLRGVAGGHGAAAQAGQRVGFVTGAGDRASQFQGLLVTPLGLREVPADPVQRSSFIQRSGLATPVAEVPVDAQGLLQHLGCSRVITRQL